METIDFTIPDFALAYLYQGDASDLNDEELYSLHALENEAPRLCEYYGGTHWHWGDGEPVGFKAVHNLAGIGACDCHRINLVIMGNK